jgi:polar amino acid transport system ATP-binding protein
MSRQQGAPQPAEPLVSVRGLGKSFGDHLVFSDVDFDVPAGAVTAIIGPSGSGKSTMLRCLNRLETPDRGVVAIAGTRYEAGAKLSAAASQALHSDVGMVFQSFNLFPHLSAEENVALALRRVRGLSRADAAGRAREGLAQVGLSDRAGYRPSQLSGGQQQRVAIARALALQPRVLLLDEPTSALDPELRAEVLQVLRRLAGTGITMLVVTHEMRFAEQVASDVLVMADGRVVEHAPPVQLFSDPQHERTRQFLKVVREP